MTDPIIKARRLHTAGQYGEAQDLYVQVIEENAHDSEALYLLGTLLGQRGKFEQALAFLSRALIESPTNSVYHCNLGVVQQNLGRFNQAMVSYQLAIKYDQQNTDAYYNLAKLYKQLGQIDAALVNYGHVLSINPQRFDALINMGNILADMGHFVEAIEHFLKAVKTNTDLTRSYINLGNTYRRMGLADQAIEAYDHVLDVRCHDGLRIKRTLTFPVIFESVRHIHEWREELTGRVRELEGEVLSVNDPSLEASTTNFHLAYQNYNDRDLQSTIARVYLKSCPRLGWTAPHCKEPKSLGGKIRIGFLSNYFRRHSVGRMMVGLISKMPKDLFDVVVITTPVQNDPIARIIEEAADEIRYLSEDLFKAQQEIGLLELDVLLYAEIGMDVRTYFLAFARLAPVQCVTWGHPDTTGIPNLDTFLSSSLIEPLDAEEHYSERLHRFSTLPTYYLRPKIPERLKSRADFGFDEKQRIYFCPQSAIKFHPDVDDLFAQILREDEESKILLLEGAVANWSDQIRQRWRRTMGDLEARVVFLPRQTPEDFLALQAIADVILDTPHFSGGNTTFEAFTLGKPVVTLDSAFMRGRVSAGMYRTMEMEDCIAQSLNEYRQIALKLGTDPEYRQEIETRIKERNEALFERHEILEEFVDYITAVTT